MKKPISRFTFEKVISAPDKVVTYGAVFSYSPARAEKELETDWEAHPHEHAGLTENGFYVVLRYTVCGKRRSREIRYDWYTGDRMFDCGGGKYLLLNKIENVARVFHVAAV